MAKKINAYYESENKRIILVSDNIEKNDYIEIDQLSDLQNYIKSKVDSEYKQNIINEFKTSESYRKILNDLQQLQSRNKELLNEQEIIKIKSIHEFKNSDEFISKQNEIIELKASLNLLENENKKMEEVVLNKFKASNEYLKKEEDLINLKNEVDKLKEKNKIIKESTINEFKTSNEYLKKDEELISLRSQVDKLQELNKNIKESTINKFKASDEYTSKDRQIIKLENDLQNSYYKHIDQYKNSDEYKANIKEKEKLEEQIQNLKRDFDSKNIKTLGEELENWCFNEYEKNFNFVEDIIFEKTTKTIEGTKPDFLLKVYTNSTVGNDEQWLNEHLCSSAIFEMKTELNSSENKKRNESHLDKLEKDRQKFKANAAVLVTELEKNDNFMIRRSNEYKDIYIIRPQMLVAFIGLFRIVSLKEKEIILSNIEFKAKNEILNEFNKFKEYFLDKLSNEINNKCESIRSDAQKIKDSAEKIIKSIDVVINTHVSALENKINKYDISKKIIKKIEE